MSIVRAVEPEWLDELPVDDQRALSSRRDLRRINALMMNARLITRELERWPPSVAAPTVIELGAGDGTFMLQLAQKSQRLETARVSLLDRQHGIDAQTRSALANRVVNVQEIVADAFEWLEDSCTAFDLIIANLFLHHFATPQLTTLLTLIESRTALFIACEPRRSRFALAASAALGLIGCNDVTRHDAVVSVRAGFRGAELSALWPDREKWHLREHPGGFFSHLFVATRASPPNTSA